VIFLKFLKNRARIFAKKEGKFSKKIKNILKILKKKIEKKYFLKKVNFLGVEKKSGRFLQ